MNKVFLCGVVALGLMACAGRPLTPMRVLQVGQPEDSVILRTASRDLTPRELRSRKIRTLKERMLLTVQSPEQDGVGIAAPQVGENLRIIWVQRFDKPGEPFECYMNAHLDSLFGEKVAGPEGCLSVPPYRGEVRRYPSVIVSYVSSETMKPMQDTVHGYTAVIFQHECDHLDGILYIDKADTVYVDPVWEAEIAARQAEGESGQAAVEPK